MMETTLLLTALKGQMKRVGKTLEEARLVRYARYESMKIQKVTTAVSKQLDIQGSVGFELSSTGRGIGFLSRV